MLFGVQGLIAVSYGKVRANLYRMMAESFKGMSRQFACVHDTVCTSNDERKLSRDRHA
jgi:hypothetical protein